MDFGVVGGNEIAIHWRSDAAYIRPYHHLPYLLILL
jgi:hypothetical protein